jgi:hypothetical protein
MADRCDGVFGATTTARAQRIGSNIDVRTSMVLVSEPPKVGGRERLFQPDDPLCGPVGGFAAKQESNGLPRGEATGRVPDRPDDVGGASS